MARRPARAGIDAHRRSPDRESKVQLPRLELSPRSRSAAAAKPTSPGKFDFVSKTRNKRNDRARPSEAPNHDRHWNTRQLDADGYTGRECPECEKSFKIKFRTGLPVPARTKASASVAGAVGSPLFAVKRRARTPCKKSLPGFAAHQMVANGRALRIVGQHNLA